MISKTFKLLTFAVLFAANTSALYCMEDENSIDNSIDSMDIPYEDISYRDILNTINSNEAMLKSYQYKLSEYNEKLDNIKKDIKETTGYYTKFLSEMKSYDSSLEEINDSNNNTFDSLMKYNQEKNVIVKLITDYNKQINAIKNYISEQVKQFYNKIFGNDVTYYFKFVLQERKNDTLKIIYKILQRYDVKEYITNPIGVFARAFDKVTNLQFNRDNISKFKKNPGQFEIEYTQKVNDILKEEYNDIEKFMREINNVPDNNRRNREINNIINITKQYLNTRKNNISAWEQRVVKIHLQKIEEEANK